MHQQVKQYFEYSKYSPFSSPLKQVNTNKQNSSQKIKTFRSQYSKQSTIQIQDGQNQQDTKSQGNGKQFSQKSSRRNSKESQKGIKESKILNKIGNLLSSVSEFGGNRHPQQQTMLSRNGFQKSKIFSNQASFRVISGNPGEQNLKSHNPSAVIIAFHDKGFIQQEERIKKKQKRMKDILFLKTPEEVFAKALRHFRDAHLLRPARNILDSADILFGKYFLYFYELRWTLGWRFILKLLSYLYLLQALLEPQNLAQKFTDDNLAQYLYGQEVVILLFCLLDNILSLYVFRSAKRNSIFKFLSFSSQFVIFIIFFIDFIIFWHAKLLGIRFSAAIRPIWLIQFHPDIYKTLKSIFLSFKKVIDIFLFFIVFSCFWGYMGYNLFSEYSEQFIDDKYFVFGSVGESILGMYTLISMDSYPTIMKNIVMDNPYYLIFFLPYVSMLLFFLLFIPVAVIFENFKQQRAVIILKDDKVSKQALTYSFYCLTHYTENDYITKDQFFTLLNAYFGQKAIREKIDNLYSILNIDKQDQMSLDEFLDVKDVMRSSERLYSNSNKYWDCFRHYCNKYFHFDRISRSYYWFYFIIFIVTVNTIMIIVYTFVEKDDDPNLDDILTNIDIFFNTIYIIDVCIKIIGLGVNEYFSDSWNNFDFTMVLISIITIFGLRYIYFLKKAKSTKLIKLTKLQKVLKIFRSIRSLKLFKILKLGADALLRVQKLFHKIALCIPSIFGLLFTYFIFSFSYAVIGVALFNTEYNSFKKGSPYDDNGYTNFNSIQDALLSLFQVITQSRWIDFLYGYGYKFNLGLSTAYFCFYHMFSILFFMSLLQGMIWDVFAVVENYFKEQELDEIYNAHFGHNHDDDEEDIQEEGEEINQAVESNDGKQQFYSEKNGLVNPPLQYTGKKSQLFQIVDGKVKTKKDSQTNPIQKSQIQFNQRQESVKQEDISTNNNEKFQTIPSDETQRNRMSTYHQIYQQNNNLNKNQLPVSQEKSEFGFKQQYEDNEEKYSQSHSTINETKKKFFTGNQTQSQEDFGQEIRELQINFSQKSKKMLSFKDTECGDIPEEEIFFQNEGNQQGRERYISEENRFVIRFNGVEIDSDNLNDLQISSPGLTSQHNSPTNILTKQNSDLFTNNQNTKLNNNQNPDLDQILDEVSNDYEQLDSSKSHDKSNNSPNNQNLILVTQFSDNILTDQNDTESDFNENLLQVTQQKIQDPFIFPKINQIQETSKSISNTSVNNPNIYQGQPSDKKRQPSNNSRQNQILLNGAHIAKEEQPKERKSVSKESRKSNPDEKFLISITTIQNRPDTIQTKPNLLMRQTQNQLSPLIISPMKFDSTQFSNSTQQKQTSLIKYKSSTSQTALYNFDQQINNSQLKLNQQTQSQQQRKTGGILKRSESSYISREKDKFVTSEIEKIDSDFDKFISKRMRVIKYEVDLIQQMNQLENFLQLHDQISLKQAEQRKNRIITKHMNLNNFSISKQYALQKMTYLKDHPSNLSYGPRQEYLAATEQLLGYSSFQTGVQQFGGIRPTMLQGIFKANQNIHNDQRYHSVDNQNKNNNQGNKQGVESNLMTLNHIDELESQQNKNDNQNGSFSAGRQQGKIQNNNDEHQNYQNSIHHNSNMNDQTFLRLNNIFSFLLQLLSNSSRLDNNFLVQKLFTIEQCINQVIFGSYNENHKINHFKFVFYAPSSSKYFALIKQNGQFDSKTEMDNSHDLKKIKIEASSIPNEKAPWNALTRSFKNENTVYFISSLFSDIESNVDQEIAKKLSDNIQYMRGYEYCLEDLSQYAVEQYASFIYSSNTPIQQTQKQNGSSQAFIGFICTKQTIQDHAKSYYKKKTHITKVFANDDNQLQNSNRKNKFDDISQPKSSRIESEPSRQMKDRKQLQVNSELNDKLDTHKQRSEEQLEDSISSNNQIKTQKLQNRNKCDDEQVENIIDITDKEDQIKEKEEEKYSEEKIDSIKKEQEQKENEDKDKDKFKNRTKTLFRQFKRNISSVVIDDKKKQLKLMKEQEHVVKIYHQIQQFFSSHSHLLQGVILRISAQIQNQVPCYEL